MNNPLQINDWEIRKFLILILSIQLALWAALCLDFLGIQVPLLRQVIGFVYLTFVPGILVLRIIKMHQLDSIEVLIYSVGLSVAILMFLGAFTNAIYPFFGVFKPISLLPLIITINAIVLVFCALIYITDNNYVYPNPINIKKLSFNSFFSLCLIPFLSIFGTYIINFYNNNLLLILLIIVIAMVAIFIGFDKFIPANLYPLAILIAAISLLFHKSLITMYIWGWDIQIESNLMNLVKTYCIWNSVTSENANAMLSVVLLGPIYSIILDISTTWVLKIIYPILFSLVPLGLFRVYQKQTNNKIAFLSCFLFISFFVFYSEMPQLARQQIAELFFVLLLLLMIDTTICKTTKSFLMIVFSASLVVSHYGLSYIYLLIIILVWIALTLEECHSIKIILSKINFISCPKPTAGDCKTISLTFVILFLTLILAWYIYISSSSPFYTIVRIGDQIAGSILTEFLSPKASEGLSLIIYGGGSTLSYISKYIHLVIQSFIFIGIVELLVNYRKMKFTLEYRAFLLVSFIICVCGIILPYFSSQLNTSRLFQIALIILAPICIIGGISFLGIVSKVSRMPREYRSKQNSFRILSIFFVIYLFFNTGWIYEVSNDGLRSSRSLNTTIDGPYFNDQDFWGAKFITNLKYSNPIYADDYRFLLFKNLGLDVGIIPFDTNTLSNELYIYLGTTNIRLGSVVVREISGVTHKMIYVGTENLIRNKDKIYNNGGAQIYY